MLVWCYTNAEFIIIIIIISQWIAAYTLAISTSHSILCKPGEACVEKWQEHWRATDSNLKKYNITKRTTPEWSHAAVAYIADGQPSALGTGRHLGSETSVGLPGEQTL